ncbi:MFS transporter [Nesterenkonia populi]|uniref:MFS transporter n=1 Tax=Nesterenkonia populi TaxID=1591087 RepID=UPI0011BFC6EB|nr:MFS transporter [Nesterenkonia populi]
MSPSLTLEASGKAAWWVLIATSVNVILVFVNATSLIIVMPVVANDFQASPAQSTWFILAYQLVLTAFIVVFGRLADIFGRKALYVFGVGVFAVSSVVAGVVGNVDLFVLARLVQGLGAAAIISNTTAILTDVFPQGKMPMALGMNATSAALGQVLGPVVGGITTEYFSWRWIFIASSALTVFSLLLSWKLVPGRTGRGRDKFDVFGSVLLISSLGAFVAGMADGSATGWSSAQGPILIMVAVALMVAFIYTQAKRSTPLVDLSLFRIPKLGRRYTAVFLCGFSHYAVILLLSIYLQAVEELSAFEVSLIAIASPLATMAAAQCAGRLVGKVSTGFLASLGMALVSTASLTLIVLLQLGHLGGYTYIALVALGLGIGLFMTPNTSLIMYITPVERRGVSNGIRSTALNLGFLTTTAVSLASATLFLSPGARAAIYAGEYPLPSSVHPDFVLGLQAAFALLALTALIGAVLGSDRRPRKTPEIPPNPSLAGGNDAHF